MLNYHSYYLDYLIDSYFIAGKTEHLPSWSITSFCQNENWKQFLTELHDINISGKIFIIIISLTI